jgi:hypothetical protein
MGKLKATNQLDNQSIIKTIDYIMKTKIILLGLFSLILILTTGCQKENDSIENIINHNNAKLKRILLYSSINSNEAICIIEEYEYDEEDRIRKVSSPLYEEGEITGIIKYDLYEYNSKGQLARIENYNANSNSPTGFINLKNYIYTYSEDGKKEKEFIEYPIISSSEYSIYKYSKYKLTRIEKYGDIDELESYVVNEYDSSGSLIKETTFGQDDQPYLVTQHIHRNGLNVQSDVFAGEDVKFHVREIIYTYDENNNLLIKESNELLSYSSMMSNVLRYEYFED